MKVNFGDSKEGHDTSVNLANYLQGIGFELNREKKKHKFYNRRNKNELRTDWKFTALHSDEDCIFSAENCLTIATIHDAPKSFSKRMLKGLYRTCIDSKQYTTEESRINKAAKIRELPGGGIMISGTDLDVVGVPKFLKERA